MKKRVLSLILAAILIAALVGCGAKNVQPSQTLPGEKQETPAAKTPEAEKQTPPVTEDPKAEKEDSQKDEGTETENAKPEEPKATPAALAEGDGISDVRDLLTGQVLPMHNGAVVLHLDTELEIENEYLMEEVYSELLTDRAIDRTWEYYYIDSLEDGAEILSWYPENGFFTSVLLVMVCTNLSEDPCIFAETANAWLVFDEGGNEKVFNGVSFQSNPDMIDEWGYENTRNATFAEIQKDELSVVSFLIDLDKATHDAMVDEERTEPIWLYFDFLNGNRYCLNLRTDMVLFGYDDSDPESAITNDIHRAMEAATGTEFMTDFLKSSKDFMEVAEMAKIDVNELAAGYASHFSISVTDIWFDDDEHATAYCTLTGPDFVEMYKALDVIGEEKMSKVDKSKITEAEFYEMYGEMMVDYTKDPDFPEMTREFEIPYHYDDRLEVWQPDDRDAAMGEMRVPLINF